MTGSLLNGAEKYLDLVKTGSIIFYLKIKGKR
jgi:hypothetical protein